ncbi:DUF2690 domain-containing protein [Streptomyces sp. NPDC094032]|uniref:DUF2690 domain-containing protein n=1 Tax=Streptomyces sp. NPDC094032 TaxID=3155308 RepID=UPI003327BBF2
MRTLLRRAAQTGTALILAAGALTLTGGSAQAATYDGYDPATTGCGGTTSTVQSAAMTDPHGNHLGTLELRYNSGCRTAWARITMDYTQSACGNASAGVACPKAWVIRNSDGRQYTCTVTEGRSSCYTPMVNDAGVSSYAQSYTDTAGGTKYTRTGSY